jgi:MFS family permease
MVARRATRSVRRLLLSDAGDRRHPLRDYPVLAAARAAGFGYTATWAGLVLSPGGLVTMVMMFVVGRLSAKFQPKYLIVIGAVFAALSMYDLTNVYADLGFWFFARSRMLLGVCR